MRYLYLALAAIASLAFATLQIPPSRITVRLLSSYIDLPSSALASLSFGLGAFAGVFLALFASSLIRGRHHFDQTGGSHARTGA